MRDTTCCRAVAAMGVLRDSIAATLRNDHQNGVAAALQQPLVALRGRLLSAQAVGTAAAGYLAMPMRCKGTSARVCVDVHSQVCASCSTCLSLLAQSSHPEYESKVVLSCATVERPFMTRIGATAIMGSSCRTCPPVVHLGPY